VNDVTRRDPPSEQNPNAVADGGRFIVPEEHRAAVLEGLRQAECGEFATDEEMAALWKKCGL
jgi:predicted transcriptional regulator